MKKRLAAQLARSVGEEWGAADETVLCEILQLNSGSPSVSPAAGHHTALSVCALTVLLALCSLP